MFRLVTLITVIIFLTRAYGQDSAFDELDQLLQDINTLSADVLQLIVESDGGVLEESDIQMHLKKPEGFYWETISPFPELIVTNGDVLWNYQPDLQQVVIEDWDNTESELAAQLLNGRVDSLEDEYTIELFVDNEFSNFELTPISLDSIYNQITISFASSNIDVIHLDNKNGEQTVWQFRDVEKNHSLADSMFEFEPPEGIDVIEKTDN